MALVVINLSRKNPTYAVYEGRKRVVAIETNDFLTKQQVEEYRQDHDKFINS